MRHENIFVHMLFQKEVKPIVNCAAIRLFFKELECHQLEFKKAMPRLKTTRRVDIQWGKIEFLVPLHTASSFFVAKSKLFVSWKSLPTSKGSNSTKRRRRRWRGGSALYFSRGATSSSQKLLFKVTSYYYQFQVSTTTWRTRKRKKAICTSCLSLCPLATHVKSSILILSYLLGPFKVTISQRNKKVKQLPSGD